MFTEARKIHLLEEVLKTTNETTLIELETVLKKSKKNVAKEKKQQIQEDYTDEYKTELDKRYAAYKKDGKVVSREAVDKRIKKVLSKAK